MNHILPTYLQTNKQTNILHILHCITLHYITLHHIALHYTSHCIAFHYITLDSISLHSIACQNSTYMHNHTIISHIHYGTWRYIALYYVTVHCICWSCIQEKPCNTWHTSACTICKEKSKYMLRKRNTFNLSSKHGGNTPHSETSSAQGLCEGHQKALTPNALKQMMEIYDEPCMMKHDDEKCWPAERRAYLTQGYTRWYT